MVLSLQEKEDRIKTALKKKVKIFHVTTIGQIGYMEATLKEYHVHSAGMILVYFTEFEGMVINADLVKVLNDSTGNYEDLW